MGDDLPPLFGGHHFRPTASFCNRIVEYEIRDELLQSAILILERTQPLHVGDVHAVQLPRGSSAGIRPDGSVRPGAFNLPDLRGGFLRGLTAHPRPGRISPTPVPDLSRSAILGTTANKSATSWTMRRRGGRTCQDVPGHCFQRENEQRRPFLHAAASCRTVLVWRRRELNPGPRIDRPQPLRA